MSRAAGNKHPSLSSGYSLGKFRGEEGGRGERFRRGLRAGPRPDIIAGGSSSVGARRSFHRPLAGGEVYREEYVELDQGRQYEEHGVHAQAGTAHFRVELEPVGGERDVEEHQRRQQRYGAVLQPAGIYTDVMPAGLRGRERRLDQPGQSEAEQYVERVRSYRVTDAHRAVS